MKRIDTSTPEGRTALVKRLARKYPFDPEWDIDLVYLRKNPRGELVQECRRRLQERGIRYEVYLRPAVLHRPLYRIQGSALPHSAPVAYADGGS